MTTKLFKEISPNTYKRIIVDNPEPYLADGWSIKPESSAEVKPEQKSKTVRKASRKKKVEE